MLMPMMARLTTAGPWPRSFSSAIGNIGRMIVTASAIIPGVEIDVRHVRRRPPGLPRLDRDCLRAST